MSPRRAIAVLATLDTKGDEAVFLRDWFRRRGWEARLIDAGTGRDPDVPLDPGDVGRAAVARAGGVPVDALTAVRRDAAIGAMGRGAAAILRAWHARGELAAVIGIGGNQGTMIAGTAMRALPFGVPRVLVSTVAASDLRPVVEHSDIAVLFSVGDLVGGPNRVTRPVLLRAAGMLAGMLDAAGAEDAAPRDSATPAVAVTALGNTHAAVLRVMAGLRARGYEPVAFHASGAGGPAMEALVREGAFAAVADLTPHELVGEVLGEDIYAPVRPGRLTAAASAGIPVIVAPGGLDYFVFGAEATVPSRFRGRPAHQHNANNTNVRANAAEIREVGRVLAERLNAARGPAALVYPRRGWSYIGREGGPLWDPDANAAFPDAVCRLLHPRVRYLEVDAAINDPPFAEAVLAVAADWLPEAGCGSRAVQGGVAC